MKLSAVTAGVVAGGFELATNALVALKDGAAAAKQETDALNESVRKLGNSNTFTSAAEGSSGLLGRVASLRDAQAALREERGKLNPSTWLGRTGQRIQYYANYGLGTSDGQFIGAQLLDIDKKNVELNASRLGGEEGRIQKQLSEALSDQVHLTHERLTGDQQTVAVMELELSRQREINELRAGGVANNLAANGKTNEQLVNERINEQIYAEAQLQAAMEDRHGLAMDIIGAENDGLTAQERAVEVARLQNRELENEQAIRIGISREEQRGMELERARNQETIRGAQFAELMKSPRQQANDRFQQQRRQNRVAQLQDRLNRTDGLINVSRDINGNVKSGTDFLTGEERGVSTGFLQPRRGLETHGLISSGGLNTALSGTSFTSDDDWNKLFHPLVYASSTRTTAKPCSPPPRTTRTATRTNPPATR